MQNSCKKDSSEKSTLEKHNSNDNMTNLLNCEMCNKKKCPEKHNQNHCIKKDLNSNEELRFETFTSSVHSFHVSDDDEQLTSDAFSITEIATSPESSQTCESVKTFTSEVHERHCENSNVCS